MNVCSSIGSFKHYCLCRFSIDLSCFLFSKTLLTILSTFLFQLFSIIKEHFPRNDYIFSKNTAQTAFKKNSRKSFRSGKIEEKLLKYWLNLWKKMSKGIHFLVNLHVYNLQLYHTSCFITSNFQVS